MKKIEAIEENLKVIMPKLEIGASDWDKAEKEEIATIYFEITKQSVGRGRTVDLGCGECVQSAVNIINNYRAAIGSSAKALKVVKLENETDWRESVKTVEAKASEVKFEFPDKKANKPTKIALLESFLSTLEAPKVEEEADPLGPEFTREQLLDVLKAKTEGDFNPADFDDYNDAELLDYVEEISKEDENEDDE